MNRGNDETRKMPIVTGGQDMSFALRREAEVQAEALKETINQPETLGAKIFKVAVGSVLGTGFVAVLGLFILKICFVLGEWLF